MTLVQAMKLLVLLSVMLTVLSLALRARAGDFFYLFREWRLGLRAVIAMFVIVPIVAIIMADVFDLKGPVKVALVALAFSPVPPLLPRKQAKAGGEASYISGLLVAAALASLVLAPIGLSLIGEIFGLEMQVSRAGMATTLGLTIALPLALGVLGQRVLGDARAGAVSGPLSKVANVLFAVSVLSLLVALAPAVGKLLGDGTIVALVAMSLVGLAAGWFLAGDDRHNRAVLALASAARHPGVAIGIATTSFPDAKLAPAAIILAAVVNTLIAIPFLKRLHKSEV
ncbi:BASS family bile acid:Na+ symporter [Novosphingobium sp. PhB165]|uniref:Na+-dependent transporter n=1 Tax=Novosphingobium sp. PhB165 TaxID=2485105 RepID=UPI0010DA1364|nr:Na+-dependent transporter [Novosphingobium sp. PhB165]TCM17134.1 BASS family bile acid:Na+ symporter [Novosphingobium sp. PhB165]